MYLFQPRDGYGREKDSSSYSVSLSLAISYFFLLIFSFLHMPLFFPPFPICLDWVRAMWGQESISSLPLEPKGPNWATEMRFFSGHISADRSGGKGALRSVRQSELGYFLGHLESPSSKMGS